MATDAPRGILGRLLGWIAAAFGASARSMLQQPDVDKVPTLLFRPRTGGRPSVSTLELARNIDRARSHVLAARLRSVAVQNVPSALVRKRRSTCAPAGKVIPKQVPRVLKSYRKSAQPPVLSARHRILKLTTLRSANVKELTRVLAELRRSIASAVAPRTLAA
ncbi:MAG: hypothetical protein WC807_01235 [Hyphomicrobium sp.]|jgi:hypothetical protein